MNRDFDLIVIGGDPGASAVTTSEAVDGHRECCSCSQNSSCDSYLSRVPDLAGSQAAKQQERIGEEKYLEPETDSNATEVVIDA